MESPTFFIPTGGAWPEMVLRRSDGSQVTVTAAQVEAMVRAAEAGKRYRSMCELFNKSLNRSDADTAYVNGMAAKRELFAALAALDKVTP